MRSTHREYGGYDKDEELDAKKGIFFFSTGGGLCGAALVEVLRVGVGGSLQVLLDDILWRGRLVCSP